MSQFVASREAFSTAWIKGTKIWQAVYSVFFVAFVLYAASAMFRTGKGGRVHVPRYAPLILLAVLLGAGVVIGGYLWWRSRQKFVLSVDGDALTIGSRGEVYSLADAKLGIWPHIGVALHLHSGSRRFVLGGLDRRIGPTTQLEAPPIQVVDARLPAAEFDELLRLGGRGAACGPPPGQPSRCILYPNAQQVATTATFAFRKKQQLVNSLGQAQLFLDVDNDTLRVVEPESHAVEASATVAQITAERLSYETRDDETRSLSKTPTLALTMPGLPLFTVGSRQVRVSGRGFSWSGSFTVVDEPPAYILSAADWLTLVTTLGLAANVDGTARNG